MLDAAYTARRDEQARGRASLLIASDTTTVTALNARAHDQVAAGRVQPGGLTLSDGTTVGRGDRIVTRHNDRRLRLPSGAYVRNGALWLVAAGHDDGSLTVAPLPLKDVGRSRAGRRFGCPRRT